MMWSILPIIRVSFFKSMNKTSSKKSSFELLFKSCYNELYIHALSFVREEQEAEDIVSDVYEYVWKNWEQLDKAIELRPLLYTLVRHRCVNFLRHERVKEKWAQAYVIDAKENGVYQDYDVLMARVMEVVELMPSQTSLVFKKCFFDRKKYKEVSDELDISVNTVHYHIKNALSILRKKVSREDLLLFFVMFNKR